VETLDSTAQAYSRLASIERARVDERIRTLNEQTAAVRNQLQVAQGDIRTRNATITTLRRQVSSLTEARDALASERDARTEEIAALQTDLDQLENQLSSSQSTMSTLRADLRERNELIASLQAEIASLRDTASGQTQSVATLNATIAAREAELASIRSQVAELEEEVSTQIAESKSSTDRALPAIQRETVAPDQVVDLLGTKIQLREAVDLPAVRSQYPSLYDDMELYFDALESESQLAGRRTALSAASEWVEDVLAQVAPGSRSFSARPYTAEGYLERLETLLTALLENVQ
jgi:chromosome segregation ATPase